MLLIMVLFHFTGEMYIMSPDVAKFVSHEARSSNCSYCEGYEDHDISSMAFHFPDPLNVVVVGKHQKFLTHPVKVPHVHKWQKTWESEVADVEASRSSKSNPGISAVSDSKTE
jgi:hypothetical protein